MFTHTKDIFVVIFVLLKSREMEEKINILDYTLNTRPTWGGVCLVTFNKSFCLYMFSGWTRTSTSTFTSSFHSKSNKECAAFNPNVVIRFITLGLCLLITWKIKIIYFCKKLKNKLKHEIIYLLNLWFFSVKNKNSYFSLGS